MKISDMQIVSEALGVIKITHRESKEYRLTEESFVTLHNIKIEGMN